MREKHEVTIELVRVDEHGVWLLPKLDGEVIPPYHSEIWLSFAGGSFTIEIDIATQKGEGDAPEG